MFNNSGMGVSANRTTLCEKVNEGIYYHYTSLDVMWKIFKSESIRATQATFSNDSEEISKGIEFINKFKDESVDKEKSEQKDEKENITIEMLDRYIFCLCGEGDKLSQWRAYSKKFGVSIGFAIDDFNTDEDLVFSCCIKGENDDMGEFKEIPLYPVYYLANRNNEMKDKIYTEEKLIKTLEKKFTTIREYEPDEKVIKNLLLSVIPYIKNSGFYEEDEYRLIYENENEKYVEYIYDQRIGIQKPYVTLNFKLDNYQEKDKIKVWCFYNKEHDYIAEIKNIKQPLEVQEIEIKDNEKMGPRIIIDSISNEQQKKIFREIDKVINDKRKGKIVPIWCKGHIPIRKIIVGPNENQQQIVNSIKHYCKNKNYWMKYIEVESSIIPYRE